MNKMHLKNHDYNPRDDVLRTYCGKNHYDIYIDREEWTDDISIVNCAECIDIKNELDSKRCDTSIQYPEILNDIGKDAKLILFAQMFGIPYEIKSVIGGDSEWGDIGTYYEVDYIDFKMPEEELEAMVKDVIMGARLYVKKRK